MRREVPEPRVVDTALHYLLRHSRRERLVEVERPGVCERVEERDVLVVANCGNYGKTRRRPFWRPSPRGRKRCSQREYW
jgi:hypothetical protein